MWLTKDDWLVLWCSEVVSGSEEMPKPGSEPPGMAGIVSSKPSQQAGSPPDKWGQRAEQMAAWVLGTSQWGHMNAGAEPQAGPVIVVTDEQSPLVLNLWLCLWLAEGE